MSHVGPGTHRVLSKHGIGERFLMHPSRDLTEAGPGARVFMG